MIHDNKKVKISQNQLFSLIAVFEIGITPLFAFGIKAKQDSWIAVLFSALIGVFLLWIFLKIQKPFPNKNFIEIITTILGKPLGIPLAILYVMFWFYATARDMSLLTEPMKMTFLSNTPVLATNTLLMMLVLSTFYMGIQTFARTSEILTPVLILSILTIFIMVFLSKIVDFNNILPILGDGFSPILKGLTPPTAVTFPYGEMVIFFMYWKYVNPKKCVSRTSYSAVAISGLLIIISQVMLILVLGVNYRTSSTIPLLDVIKLIHIGDVITNLDSYGMVLLFIGGYFRICIYFYGCVLGLCTIFNIKKIKLCSTILAILVIWYTSFFIPNYPFMIWMLGMDSYFILIPLLIIIPCLLLILYWLKNKIGILK